MAIRGIVNLRATGNAKPQLLGLFRIVVRTLALHMDGSRSVGVLIEGGKKARLSSATSDALHRTLGVETQCDAKHC
jgi:hypothetical protein